MKNTSDTCTYILQFSGELEADFLASFCPAGTTLTIRDNITTLSNLRTDQSGILGIIRHLHNLGILILEMTTLQDNL
jgi:hypothetical protein